MIDGETERVCDENAGKAGGGNQLSPQIYNAVVRGRAILAANEVFQRRGDKLVEFRDAYRRWADDIARMTIDDAKGDRSLEYTKDRLDGRLRAVLPEKDFEDWGKRYGGIK